MPCAAKVTYSEETGPAVKLESELAGINGAVNCIRRSLRDSDVFASGGDKGEVIVWKRNREFQRKDPDDIATKPWKPAAFLRGHANDVFDMAWSSDGSALVTTSLEGVTIVWDVQREKPKIRLCDHHHYVQGVAWDPLNEFLVTQGGDRRCKIYTRSAESQSKKEVAAKTGGHWKVGRTLFKTKASTSTLDSAETIGRDFLFHDDTLLSFFRRLDWTPDGSFLVIPAGLKRTSGEMAHVAYVYSRGKWSVPVGCFPGAAEPFVIVRCCPVLFEKHRESDENSISDLPYDVIFACATLHHLFIYNSSKSAPIAVIVGLHYSAITDMAWSENGTHLVISSRDGYCSIVHFDPGDLGIVLDRNALSSQDSFVSTWFRGLENVRCRVEAAVEKRTMQPRKAVSVVSDEEKRAGVQNSSSRKQSSRRRITPIAVESAAAGSGITSLQLLKPPMVPSVFGSRVAFRDSLLTDLRQLAVDSAHKQLRETESQSTDAPPPVDLLAMTRRYSQCRFGPDRKK